LDCSFGKHKQFEIFLRRQIIGAVQVSRKGANPASAGRDFSADDLGKIVALCKPLGKLLHHVAGERSFRARRNCHLAFIIFPLRPRLGSDLN